MGNNKKNIKKEVKNLIEEPIENNETNIPVVNINDRLNGKNFKIYQNNKLLGVSNIDNIILNDEYCIINNINIPLNGVEIKIF